MYLYMYSVCRGHDPSECYLQLLFSSFQRGRLIVHQRMDPIKIDGPRHQSYQQIRTIRFGQQQNHPTVLQFLQGLHHHSNLIIYNK